MPRKLNIFSMYEETLRIAIIMQKVYKISTTKRLAMLMHIKSLLCIMYQLSN